jgi:hypothetical protein
VTVTPGTLPTGTGIVPASGAESAAAPAASAAAASVPNAGPTSGRTIQQGNGTPRTRRTLGAQNEPGAVALVGQLPFTGLLLGLIALIGAALASAGLGLRSYAHT